MTKRSRSAVREYAEIHPVLRRAADEAVNLVTHVLDDAGINYLTVSGRAKSVRSFGNKLERVQLDDPITEMTDLIGIRVITYVHSDVAAVADLLDDQLDVHDDRDLGLETASQGRFGYASRHLQARVRAEDRVVHPALGERQFQIQIRTVLQHAWAEFEHDIRYKGHVPDEHGPEFDRRFTLAAGLLELADREFSAIRSRLSTATAPSPFDAEDPRIAPAELAAFLAGQYADAGWSRTDHYTWMSDLVLELGVTSLAELADVVREVDSTAIDKKLAYKHAPGAVRRLDDALLASYGERYIRLHGNTHRVAMLEARLEKMTAE